MAIEVVFMVPVLVLFTLLGIRGFLRRALDLTFFPELYEVRTGIGASAR